MSAAFSVVYLNQCGKLASARKDFSRVYRECFAEAPYFERFSIKESGIVFDSMIDNPGAELLGVFQGQRLISFCGGYSLVAKPEIAALLGNRLRRLKILPSEVFYLAELGVDRKYRHQGLAGQMVEKIIAHVANRDFRLLLTRTQTEGSNSLQLFLNVGMQVLPKLSEEVKTYIGEKGRRLLVAQRRIFLAKALVAPVESCR
jgi:ribosomal protein S18 acetylase RimI-like enzyme